MGDLVVENRRFRVIGADRGASSEDIAVLEQELGAPLPPQLRDYYLRYNGGLPFPADVPEDRTVWARLRWEPGSDAASVGPASNVGALLRINAPPGVDFLRTWTDFKDRLPVDAVCFARAPGGSLFLIGTGTRNNGRIFYWERSREADRGAGESPGYDNVADVAGSFHEFLLALREEPGEDESLEDWVRRAYAA